MRQHCTTSGLLDENSKQSTDIAAPNSNENTIRFETTLRILEHGWATRPQWRCAGAREPGKRRRGRVGCARAVDTPVGCSGPHENPCGGRRRIFWLRRWFGAEKAARSPNVTPSGFFAANHRRDQNIRTRPPQGFSCGPEHPIGVSTARAHPTRPRRRVPGSRAPAQRHCGRVAHPCSRISPSRLFLPVVSPTPFVFAPSQENASIRRPASRTCSVVAPRRTARRVPRPSKIHQPPSPSARGTTQPGMKKRGCVPRRRAGQFLAGQTVSTEVSR